MGKGWFFKLRLADKGELDGLMDEAAYKAFVEGPASLMRYLPLTDADRRDMLAMIGAHVGRRAVPRRAGARRGSTGRSTCRRHQGELEVERAFAALAAQEPAHRRRRRSSSAPAPIAITCRRPSTT